MLDGQAILLFMGRDPKKNPVKKTPRRAEYQQLRRQLGRINWISQGYVQDRGPGAGGPCYQWTRKIKGKTISVALSKEQYEWLRQAIANWREAQAILKKMQRLSREELFETLPEPKRRKRLSKKVLGLN
jgi:cyclopropane fatty-acyl-phospholipid synthase-like methyltransferase